MPAADKILAATQVDAFPLFAGVAAEPMVDDIAGRAMQLLIVLREYRGSAHLVTRPNDAAMFGWGPDDVPVIDDSVRVRMRETDAITDRLVRPAFAVLDANERRVFVDGLHEIQRALTS